MATITSTAGSITPMLVLVDGYSQSGTSANIVHELVGGTIAVSLAPDLPRTGTLSLLFATPALAEIAREFHTTGDVFTLVDSDTPQASMTYVRQGPMSVKINSDVTERWALEVGFQEVVT